MKTNSKPGTIILQIIFFLLLITYTLFIVTTKTQSGEIPHLFIQLILLFSQGLLIYFFKKNHYNVGVIFTIGKSKRTQFTERIIWSVFIITAIFIIIEILW